MPWIYPITCNVKRVQFCRHNAYNYIEEEVEEGKNEKQIGFELH